MEVAPDTTNAETIAELLHGATNALAAAGVSMPRLDAEVLLATACGVDRAALYAGRTGSLPAAARTAFVAMMVRRLAREPVQYIVGRQEFWSLEFTVTPEVLIPRPETELLVELAVSSSTSLPRRGRSGRRPAICDLGTGSGCIAVALAVELVDAEIWALDVSPAALRVAADNARRHRVADRIHFVASDLFAALDGRRFDVIVSNPPYVTAAELTAAQPELRYEPRRALDGGAEGFDVIRRLIVAAAPRLVDGGLLFMEIGAAQADAVSWQSRQAGARDAAIVSDYAGLPRILRAQWS